MFIMSAHLYRYLMTVRPATRSLSQTCYGSGRRALHRFRISPSLFTLRPKCRRKAYMFDGFCACRVRTNAIIPSTNASTSTSTSASTRTGTSIGANACVCVCDVFVMCWCAGPDSFCTWLLYSVVVLRLPFALHRFRISQNSQRLGRGVKDNRTTCYPIQLADHRLEIISTARIEITKLECVRKLGEYMQKENSSTRGTYESFPKGHPANQTK